MRGCIWSEIKPENQKSPLSPFYYSPQITTQMILNAVTDGSFFGLLEVDIICPESLRKELRSVNFPPIFDKIAVTKEMLSDQMLSRCQQKKFPLKPQLTLVYDAKYYLLTSDFLQFYLQLGLKVEKIHYCVEYQRSKPLAPFIKLGNL